MCMYGCHDGFGLFMVDMVMLEISCEVIKGAGGVGILMRSTIMAKFQRDLDLKDVCGG